MFGIIVGGLVVLVIQLARIMWEYERTQALKLHLAGVRRAIEQIQATAFEMRNLAMAGNKSAEQLSDTATELRMLAIEANNLAKRGAA